MLQFFRNKGVLPPKTITLDSLTYKVVEKISNTEYLCVAVTGAEVNPVVFITLKGDCYDKRR